MVWMVEGGWDPSIDPSCLSDVEVIEVIHSYFWDKGPRNPYPLGIKHFFCCCCSKEMLM